MPQTFEFLFFPISSVCALTLGAWGVKTPQIALGVWSFEAAV
jgi:hypothetical protein